MTTYYIDPTSPTNGDGLSELTPFNTWDAVTYEAGNTYLQKQGTIFNGKILVSSGGADESSRVNLSIYGPAVIPLESGLSQQKAKINANGYDRALQVAVGAHYVTVDNFEIYGANTKTASVRGVVIGSTVANRTNNVTIKNCIIRDIGSTVVLPEDENGIQCFGDNFRLLNTEIYNIADDGVWVQGSNFEAGHVNVHHVSKSGRLSGDCMQISNASGVSSNYWVHHCILDHSNVEIKQCFIDATGVDGSTGGIFEHNTCIMGTDNTQSNTSKTVNIGNPNVIVRGNNISGGWAGLWLLGNNIKATGNLITQFKYVGSYIYALTTGISIYNNTFYSNRVDKIANSVAIDIASTTVTANVVNNIFYGSGIDYGITCYKSAATANGIDIRNNIGYVNTSAFSVSGGVDSSNVSTNPLLDINHSPASNSPAIGTGFKYWTGARTSDVNGEPLPDTAIDIGAVQSTGNANHPKNLINSSNPSATAMDLITYSPAELQVQLDKVTELDGRIDDVESKQIISKNITWDSAAPTTGTYAAGDIVYNSAPAASGTIGWVCVTAGTPGTWKTFGAISA